MIAVLLVLVAVLGVLGFLYVRPSDSRRFSWADTAGPDQELLAAAQTWAQAHPGEYAEAFRRFGYAMSQMRDPKNKEKARRALLDLEAAQRQAAERAFEKLSKEADQLAKAGDYDAAIAKCRQLPAQFADIVPDRVKSATEALAKDAEGMIGPILARADGLVDGGAPDKALEELEKLNAVRFSALAPQIQRLRQKADARVSEAIEKVLDAVDAAVARNDFAEAGRLAQAAATDPKLAAATGLAAAVTRVGKVLSELNPEKAKALKPGTPDESIAAAMLAYAARNASDMSSALGGAGAHELRRFYAAKLDRLKTNSATTGQLLDAFRREFPAALGRREYGKIMGELDKMIGDPAFGSMKDGLAADRRPVEKLAALMERIRSNVKGNVGNDARHRGADVKIEKFENDKITFADDDPVAVTDLRTADLKDLLNLDPGPEAAYREGLALLFVADRDIEKAQGYIANLADKGDAMRLQQMLDIGRKEPVLPAGDPAAADPQKALRAALAKNEELYNASFQACTQEIERVKSKCKDEWAKICTRVSDLEKRLEDAQQAERRSKGYTEGRHNDATEARARASEKLDEARREQTQSAQKIKAELAKCSRKAAAQKDSILVVRERQRRLMTLNKKPMSEAEMKAAYDAAMNRS